PRGAPSPPRRYAGQHGLGKAPPLIELTVGLDQFALLALDLIGHPVEGAAQRDPLVVLLVVRDTGGEIASANPFGGSHQPADRIGELSREMNTDRDCRG